MNYQNIYTNLKEFDVSLTEEMFSTDYLGMSTHYISMCKSRGINISANALVNLLRNLRRLATLWSQIAKESKTIISKRATIKAEHYVEQEQLVLSLLVN